MKCTEFVNGKYGAKTKPTGAEVGVLMLIFKGDKTEDSSSGISYTWKVAGAAFKHTRKS
jgi:hypothetical protein